MISAETLDLETAEQTVRDGVLAIGARLLEAGRRARRRQAGSPPALPVRRDRGLRGLSTQGGADGSGVDHAAPGLLRLPRLRPRPCPLDAALGVGRDSLSPGVRRLACRFGAQLPFADAAEDLAEAARVRLSASTVRTVTEAVGARREAALLAEIAAAWVQGLPASGAAPSRLYVAMDGIRILGTDGAGREVKVGVVVPVRGAGGERREPASYVAGLEPAARFGPRLALEAHRRGLDGAGLIAVLGDGAEWIWNLAAEHFPTAVQIVDWFHASERVWALGRALYGEARRRRPPGSTRSWPIGRGPGGVAGGRVAGTPVSGRDRRGAGCAGHLFHQPGLPHGLRSLSRRGLGHRLRHGGERL